MSTAEMTAVPAPPRDYSLIGRDAQLAVESGLAAAEWYHTDIPRKRMKELMQRSDGPAIRAHALSGSSAFIVSGCRWRSYFYGSWWCVPFFFVYGVLYGSSSDSRWHECGHGTAFKTSWMNRVVYQIACFMIMREPTVWRWSHARHHTDTIIVGRDPEIGFMRPAGILRFSVDPIDCMSASWMSGTGIDRTCCAMTAGTVNAAEEKTFIPETELPKVFFVARHLDGDPRRDDRARARHFRLSLVAAGAAGRTAAGDVRLLARNDLMRRAAAWRPRRQCASTTG